MFEMPQHRLGNTVLSPAHTHEIERTVAEVQALDRELVEHEDTRQLLELGALFNQVVTKKFGTPAAPQWASGTYETDVLMSFHNGGEDGHTSVGPNGSGVPRNVLLIARAVHTAAGYEVYSPIRRAAAFYAAEAHDSHQLCGRTLLPEGADEGRGDERLSAENARGTYLTTYRNTELAQRIYRNVMATAYNPDTRSQNIDYSAWDAAPNDPEVLQTVLDQELLAAADLLHITSRRGPLGALEVAAEGLCLRQNAQIMQERLQQHGMQYSDITTAEQLFEFIGQDDVLRSLFVSRISGEPKFFLSLKYSDKAIRTVCGGQGIDDLFPGRKSNATVLDDYAELLREGRDPKMIWAHARLVAGY